MSPRTTLFGVALGSIVVALGCLKPPVATAPLASPTSVGGGDPWLAPKALYQPTPVFPAAPVTLLNDGVAPVRVLVGYDGIVTEVKVLRGDPRVFGAVIDAARNWRFQPLLVDGKQTAWRGTVIVRFRFKDPRSTAPAERAIELEAPSDVVFLDVPQPAFAPLFRGSVGRAFLRVHPVVLPVRNCTKGRDFEVPPSPLIEKLAAAVWPGALWKALRLPGEPRTEEASSGDLLCDLAWHLPWQEEFRYPGFNGAPTEYDLNALHQVKVQEELKKRPGRDALLLPYWWPTYGTFTDRVNGQPVRSRRGAVGLGVLVVTTGQIVWHAREECGPGAGSCLAEVDKDFRNADAAAAGLLRDFPWEILGVSSSGTAQVSSQLVAD